MYLSAGDGQIMKQLWVYGLIIALTGAVVLPVQAESESQMSLISAGQASALDLSPAQKKALFELQKQTHTNLEAILTPTQVQQFQAGLAQGQTTRDALKAADLNIRQKIRVKDLLEGTVEQMKTILTPAQFEQIKASLS